MKKKSPSRLPVLKKSRRKPRDEADVPKSELDELAPITFSMSTLFTLGAFSDVTIAMSEPFTAVKPKEINQLFAEKLKECTKICDFSIGLKDQQAKKNKRELLRHFIEAFENNKILHNITPGNIRKFIEMVVDNVSRPFPSMIKITAFDFGDQMEDTAWPHLQLVYKATIRLFDSNLTFELDNANFLSCLVTNACSPDDRERQACRDILTSVYRKCEKNRPQIFRFVMNQFLTLICSKELLEFFILVVDSLPLPLSEKNVFFFKQCVLVLHSSHLFLRFCLSLLQVINHYIKVDSSLLEPTFEYIFRHWPCATVRKQLIFMSEIEGLVVSYTPIITPKMAEMIFTQISKLVNSPNVEMAERALNLILGMSLEKLIIENAQLAMDIFVPVLLDSARKNWNEYVREDAGYGLTMFNQMDEQMYTGQKAKMSEAKKRKKAYKKICRTHWQKVFEMAKMNYKSIKGINMAVVL